MLFSTARSPRDPDYVHRHLERAAEQQAATGGSENGHSGRLDTSMRHLNDILASTVPWPRFNAERCPRRQRVTYIRYATLSPHVASDELGSATSGIDRPPVPGSPDHASVAEPTQDRKKRSDQVPKGRIVTRIAQAVFDGVHIRAGALRVRNAEWAEKACGGVSLPAEKR